MDPLIKKVGRWDVAGLFARNLHKDIPEELTVALKQIGLEAEGVMKKLIRDQPSGWAKLSEAYEAYKERKGLSTKTLIATSSMVQSITSIAVYPSVFIGIKRGKKNKNNEEIANIAAVMNFGTKKAGPNKDITIPARPYLEPTNEIMKERLSNNLLGRRIIEFLKKKYNIGSGGSSAPGPIKSNESFESSNSEVFTGSRGGKYKLSDSGKKLYQKR